MLRLSIAFLLTVLLVVIAIKEDTMCSFEIKVPTTWKADKVHYVTQDIFVTSDLTIEPGAIIKYHHWKRIIVKGNGRIITFSSNEWINFESRYGLPASDVGDGLGFGGFQFIDCIHESTLHSLRFDRVQKAVEIVNSSVVLKNCRVDIGNRGIELNGNYARLLVEKCEFLNIVAEAIATGMHNYIGPMEAYITILNSNFATHPEYAKFVTYISKVFLFTREVTNGFIEARGNIIADSMHGFVMNTNCSYSFIENTFSNLQGFPFQLKSRSSQQGLVQGNTITKSYNGYLFENAQGNHTFIGNTVSILLDKYSSSSQMFEVESTSTNEHDVFKMNNNTFSLSCVDSMACTGTVIKLLTANARFEVKSNKFIDMNFLSLATIIRWKQKEQYVTQEPKLYFEYNEFVGCGQVKRMHLESIAVVQRNLFYEPLVYAEVSELFNMQENYFGDVSELVNTQNNFGSFIDISNPLVTASFFSGVDSSITFNNIYNLEEIVTNVVWSSGKRISKNVFVQAGATLTIVANDSEYTFDEGVTIIVAGNLIVSGSGIVTLTAHSSTWNGIFVLFNGSATIAKATITKTVTSALRNGGHVVLRECNIVENAGAGVLSTPSPDSSLEIYSSLFKQNAGAFQGRFTHSLFVVDSTTFDSQLSTSEIMSFKQHANITISGCNFSNFNVQGHQSLYITATGADLDIIRNQYSNISYPLYLMLVESDLLISENTFVDCADVIHFSGTQSNAIIQSSEFRKVSKPLNVLSDSSNTSDQYFFTVTNCTFTQLNPNELFSLFTIAENGILSLTYNTFSGSQMGKWVSGFVISTDNAPIIRRNVFDIFSDNGGSMMLTTKALLVDVSDNWLGSNTSYYIEKYWRTKEHANHYKDLSSLYYGTILQYPFVDSPVIEPVLKFGIRSRTFSGEVNLHENIEVSIGSTLTILPGAKLVLQSGVKLIVYGHLDLIGTEEQPIDIICQDLCSIQIKRNATISPIHHVRLYTVDSSILTNNYIFILDNHNIEVSHLQANNSGPQIVFKLEGSIDISDSSFQNVGVAIYLVGTITLRNVQIVSSASAIKGVLHGHNVIENSKFFSYGTYVFDVQFNLASLDLLSNEIHAFDYCILEARGSINGDIRIIGNIIKDKIQPTPREMSALFRMLLGEESSGALLFSSNNATQISGSGLLYLSSETCGIEARIVDNYVVDTFTLNTNVASFISILQRANCANTSLSPPTVIQNNYFDITPFYAVGLLNSNYGQNLIHNNTFMYSRNSLVSNTLGHVFTEASNNYWHPKGLSTVYTNSIYNSTSLYSGDFDIDNYYVNPELTDLRYSVCKYEYCHGTFRLDDHVCGGHGTCIALDVCECYDRWEGFNCTIPICDPGYLPYGFYCYPGCDGISGGDESVCSSRGECIEPEVCNCNYGFQGTNRCNYTMQVSTFTASYANGSIIGECESLVLNANVDPTVGSTNALYNWYLNDQLFSTKNTISYSISSTDLPPGINYLHLVITSSQNSLKTYPSTKFKFSVVRQLRPSISVFGSALSGRTIDVIAGNAFSINAQSQDPPCTGASFKTAVSFEYRRVTPTAPIGSTVLNSYFLSGEQLRKSGLFTYEVTAFRTFNNIRIGSSITVYLNVYYLKPMSIIQGGSRNIGRATQVVVNSLSSNPNRVNPLNNGAVLWKFQNNRNGTCLEGNNSGLFCTIDMQSINQVDVFLNFTIPEDNLSDASSVRITRQVEIPENPILFLSTLPQYINNNDRLILSGSATPLSLFASVKYKWNIVDTLTNNVIVEGPFGYDAKNAPIVYLTLESGRLNTGRLYLFKLIFTIPLSTGNVDISSQLQTTVVKPPTISNFSVSPNDQIFEYETDISVLVDGKDQEIFLPLEYSFSLTSSKTNDRITLSPFSRTNSYNTKLNAGEYVMRGCVRNRINAFSCAESTILVQTKQLTSDQITAIINQGIESIIHSDNIESAIALLLQFSLTSTNETERVATALKLLDILEATFHLRKNSTDINTLIDTQLDILKLFTSDTNPIIQNRVADYMLLLLEEKIKLLLSNDYGYSLGKILDGELFVSIATTISNILNGTQDSVVSSKVIAGLDKLVKLAITDMIPSNSAINYTSPSLSIYLATLYGSMIGGSLSAPNTDGNYIYLPSLPTEPGGVITVQIFEIKKDLYNSQNITSNIIDFTVIKNGTVVPLKDLETPFNLTFTANRPLKPGEAYKCQYWNETLQEWDDRGCKTLNIDPCIELTNSTEVRCQCDHTTEFAAFIVRLPPCKINQSSLDIQREVALKSVDIATKSMYAVICVVVFVYLFIHRNKQPVRSRMAAPFIGLISLFIESVLYISQNSVVIRLTIQNSNSAAAGNIIGFVVSVVVNTVSLVSLFCYLMQIARYTTLRNMYAIIKKVKKVNARNKQRTNLQMKIYKIVISQYTFIIGITTVVVLSAAYFTYFAISVGIPKGSYIDAVVYMWVVSLSYATASIVFCLMILLLFTWDIIVRKPKKMRSKTHSEHNGLLRQFFIIDDPLYFRMELLFFLGAFTMLMVSIISGLVNTGINGQEGSLEASIISYIVSVLYFAFSIGMYGGFLCCVVTYELVIQRRSKYLLLNDSSSNNLTKNQHSKEEQEIINMIRSEKGYFLIERYCIAEFSVENVLVLKEIEDLKSFIFSVNAEEKYMRMRELYDKYISKDASTQVNLIASSVRQFEEFIERNKVEEFSILSDIPDAEIEDLIAKVQNGATTNLMDTWSRFCLTNEYQVFRQSHEVTEIAMSQFGLSKEE